jgi:hypothetical protein
MNTLETRPVHTYAREVVITDEFLREFTDWRARLERELAAELKAKHPQANVLKTSTRRNESAERERRLAGTLQPRCQVWVVTARVALPADA